ncbi:MULTISPECIES: polysaccharide deacetylase family protein [unclassified Paenibacillus]|uniref:polysaccharide deacetylase family protein n=1 Tax=unclassified Paenibacillus TaxID=185978 RepID=UPI0027D8E135|nr:MULTISPECIES: polysaccharide deacetylase family protein [unclassified Paenibacillus]
MNYQRKRILIYSVLAGLFTILLLLVSIGLSSSGYRLWGSSAAPALVDYQVDAQIDESPSQAPVEVYTFVEDKPVPSLEITPDLPLIEEPKLPAASTVTLDTYVPVPAPVLAATPSAASEIKGTIQSTTKPAPMPSKISIPVLNYHSVTIDPGNVVVISPAKLEEQLAYLHNHGFTPVSLTTFISLIEGKGVEAAPEKPVLLTFDDGYIDNYEQAMPLLTKYSFPATLFISPGTSDQEGYLNWEQIKKMQEAGWDIQPHGMTHPHLPQLSADQQAYEILEARKQIEEKLGTKADVYCYPYGEYNKTTLKLLKDHGFRYAFTIEQGYATNQQSPYLLKRLFINGEESLKSFIRKLSTHD